MNILAFVIIGIISGWLSGRMIKGHGFGLLGNLVVGSIGGVLGGFMFETLDVIAQGTLGAFVTAVFGSAVMLFVFSGFKRSRI